MNLNFSNYETTYFDGKAGYTCVYCGNDNLVIDDSFDQYQNYQGTRYYCTCEQAKVEQEMKRKISALTSSGMLDLIPKAQEEYLPKLKPNNVMINQHKFENELYTFFNHHLYRENLLRLRSLYED